MPFINDGKLKLNLYTVSLFYFFLDNYIFDNHSLVSSRILKSTFNAIINAFLSLYFILFYLYSIKEKKGWSTNSWLVQYTEIGYFTLPSIIEFKTLGRPLNLTSTREWQRVAKLAGRSRGINNTKKTYCVVGVLIMRN